MKKIHPKMKVLERSQHFSHYKSMGIFPDAQGQLIVREPVIGLTKWLRPNGLKVCSYVEKCAEFKNQTLKNLAGTQKCYVQQSSPRGMQYLKIALKWEVPLQVYNLKHVTLVVKCKIWQQTMFNIKIKIRHAKDAF